MNFAAPGALWLLLALPVLWYIGWPRHRFRLRRDSLSLLLRTLIVILLILSMAGLESVRATDQLSVVFVVDLSDSLGGDALTAAENYIRDAIAHMAADDRFGVVVFGQEARIVRPVSVIRNLNPIRSEVHPGNTDIAEGLRKALSIFPPDAARRIVLISDGQETTGDAARIAQLAHTANVEISFVAPSPEKIPDIRVTRFHLPQVVSAGQEFEAEIAIDADLPTLARVIIEGEEQRLLNEIIALQAGRNQRALTLRGEERPGNFLTLELSVEALDPALQAPGQIYQNDRLTAVTRVLGEPSVLLVSPSPAETLNLLPALQSAGLQIQTVTPQALPNHLNGFAPYDVVVLANVSALGLTEQRMQALEEYVRDFGGGLVTIGGHEAFAPGGYADTPLERVLPLEMRLRDEERLPQLNIIYVIDHSGSMGTISSSGDVLTHLQYAQEAIVRSLEYLQREDRAAIVGFDASAFLISPFQTVADARRLQRPVLSLRASGGTDILAGLSLAAEIAPFSEADLTHIILLTDGGASETGLIELASALHESANISTSVVSIGRSPVPFLRELAEAGDGHFHHVTDAASIPAIFAAETILATRSYIMEQYTALRAQEAHPITRGLSDYPILNGYVAASAKDNAQVLIRGGSQDDPILTAWQYGLGRSVAFTSDAKAQWASEWVGWAEFAPFWNQVLRWTITRESGQLETQVYLEGETARIVTQALDDQDHFWNNLQLQATLNFPGGSTQSHLSLALDQVAPGRYEATFTPERDGAYLIHVQSGDPAVPIQSRSAWTLSYSEEYLPPEQDGRLLLANLAEQTGGQDRSANAASAFDHDLRAEAATQPMRQGLLLAALLLLPLDIALRRIVLSREDWRALRTFLFPQRAATGARERIATLLEQKSPKPAPATAITPQRIPSAPSSQHRHQPAYQARTAPLPSPIPEAPQTNLGARLLRERRQRARRVERDKSLVD
ncbi:MAG: VWA domain-containing protein [Anaerolineaceae bacterium]|nr:VWA domain-containing protein [Anaerolineaceae bacterium]